MTRPMTRLYFYEVVTRGGFQMEPTFIPTDQKIALIYALGSWGWVTQAGQPANGDGHELCGV